MRNPSDRSRGRCSITHMSFPLTTPFPTFFSTHAPAPDGFAPAEGPLAVSQCSSRHADGHFGSAPSVPSRRKHFSVIPSGIFPCANTSTSTPASRAMIAISSRLTSALGRPRRGERAELLREVPLDPPAIGIPEAHRVVGGKIGAGEFLRRCDGQDELERGGRGAGGAGAGSGCG